MDRCKDYVGVACVDGTCPVGNYHVFMAKGMPEIAKAFKDAGNCNDCSLYKGCEDCFLNEIPDSIFTHCYISI